MPWSCTRMRLKPPAWMRKSVKACAIPPETWPPASTLPANSRSEMASRSGGPHCTRPARHAPPPSAGPAAPRPSRPGRWRWPVRRRGRRHGARGVAARGAKTMKRWNSVWLSHFSRKGPKSALKWLAPGSGGATAMRCASVHHRLPRRIAPRRIVQQREVGDAQRRRHRLRRTGMDLVVQLEPLRMGGRQDHAVTGASTPACSAMRARISATSSGRSSCARWPRPAGR